MKLYYWINDLFLLFKYTLLNILLSFAIRCYTNIGKVEVIYKNII